ncbi:MAG: transcription elongation factor GreA [Eubacterium sp.]|nr:transcription elongation factor GreA [Eubacterium sp.]
MGYRLTKEDIRKMEDEILYRKRDLRPELLEKVKEARSHGDLSENFEYHAAKREKNKNDSRIRYLERAIRNAVMIEDRRDEDEAGLNKKARLYMEEDGVEQTCYIVTTMRANALKGRVSIESPLGKALLGHKKDDRVEVRVSDSYSFHAVILSVESFDESEIPISNY